MFRFSLSGRRVSHGTGLRHQWSMENEKRKKARAAALTFSIAMTRFPSRDAR
jgi:hypothetical protein